MKIITVILLVTLCTSLTVARVLPTKEQKSEEKAVSPDAEQESDKDTPEDDGSGSALEMFDSSGEGSASGDEEQNDELVELPRPMQFPFSQFKGPVTITPMEPGINNEKPVRRPCYMCFPRGRLGRVEVTAPGGPFLMNNFGLAGYGMGFPGMGPMAPVGSPDMGFPEYGPYNFGPGPCGPDNDGPCNNDEGSYNEPEPEPMEFQEMSEGPEVKPAHTSHKVMDHSPAKGAASSVVKPAAGAPVAAVSAAVAAAKAPHGPASAPLKGVADELQTKPVAQLAVTVAENGAQTAQFQPSQPAQPAPMAQQVNDKVQAAQQQPAQPVQSNQAQTKQASPAQ